MNQEEKVRLSDSRLEVRPKLELIHRTATKATRKDRLLSAALGDVTFTDLEYHTRLVKNFEKIEENNFA